MKEKLLDYLLLNKDVYTRPLRKRSVLFLLCLGAGLIITLGYLAQNGFTLLNDVYAAVMTLGLVLFSGIFAMVVFAWPAADFAANMDKATGQIGAVVKRLKIAKGFLLTVIYTGVVSNLLKMILRVRLEDTAMTVVSIVISVAVSVWAGAMITRCITSVYEETASKKLTVFIASTAWYYIIVIQIMDFIIRGAYSIIL